MKTAMSFLVLCLTMGMAVAQGQDLKIDFSQTAGPVQTGYQAYRADHEVVATFTAQSFSAFDTTVTILPTWASGAVAAAMQMIQRADDDDTESPDLIRDWIGTDGRSVGDPMTLTIKGLPAGQYNWLSYHHDPQDQTGVFSVTVNDAMGSATTTGIDISDLSPSGVLALADMTKFTTRIVANGTDDVSLVFDITSSTGTTATAFFVMNAFEMTSIDTGSALLPNPSDRATDVPRAGTVLSWMPNTTAVSQDVYFGTDHDDIDDGMTTSSVYMGRQDVNSYDPGLLEFGQTYYWRVDQVAPDGSLVKGSVWSFTVEPVSVVLASDRITATASSTNTMGGAPSVTIDRSGLGAGDQHSTITANMWLSASADPGPIWIQYEFDGLFKLHQMLVWNHNTSVESGIGFGVKDATIEYSRDGVQWATLGTTHEFAQATGLDDYAANTTIDFAGTVAKYVRITVIDNWGTAFAQAGLSEVRFMVVPTTARSPVPTVGATGVVPQTTLTWRAGRDAVTQRVYLSDDVNEVTTGAALVGTVSEAEFDADTLLGLDKTYYWRVDEVNDAEDPAVWEGEVWSFTTGETLSVDDMESYNDADGKGTRIYETWADGYGVNGNGSQVGHFDAPFAEGTIIHGAAQSMPFYYDATTEGISEATRTFDPAQDWTLYGVQGLTLWFFGDPTNTTGQMYVKINGSKVAYDGDADNLLRKPWQKWYIPLSSFSGVNLQKVTSMVIGVTGGVGVLYIDDIGLSPEGRELVTPVQPDATNLVAKYALDGNVNDATGKLNGTIGGAPTYVAGKVGQAIHLDGARDYVLVVSSLDLPVYTAALWFQVEGGTGNRDLISIFNDAALHGVLLEVTSTGGLRFLHRAPVGSTGGDADIRDSNKFDDAAWYHAAIVKSAESTTLYINGVQAGTMASATQFDQPLTKIALGLLKTLANTNDPVAAPDGRYFPGAIDEVYLYGRVLSDAEIAGLAGRTAAYDKP
ncbi:MAG: discoidin domain-containing protein [Phycisphaerae bacterium]|nr:discoidin domain-containing protein [Phycisphaerae bacterium]